MTASDRLGTWIKESSEQGYTNFLDFVCYVDGNFKCKLKDLGNNVFGTGTSVDEAINNALDKVDANN